MLDSEWIDLLTGLSESEYVTSKKLAEQLGISDRTIRTRIQELREELERNGAAIESRQRYGYRLVVRDKSQYRAWLQFKQAQMQKNMPNSIDERFRYLLALFLRYEDY